MLSGKGLAYREHLLVEQTDAAAERTLHESSSVVEVVRLVGI